MLKNPKHWWKLIKITNIVYISWKTWEHSIKSSGKIFLKIILKIIKNEGFTIFLEDTFFEKPLEEIKLTPPSSRFRVTDIYNKRLDNIDELSNTTHYGDLKFIISSSSKETDFSELKDLVAFLDSTRKLERSIEEARHRQEEFDKYLKNIRIGNKSKKQKETLVNVNNRRNDAIKLIDDYGSMILEAKIMAAKKEPKPEPTKAKTKHKKSPFELHEKFINEIKDDKKNVNEEMFKRYLFNHTPLFLAKELYNSNQDASDEL